MITSDSGRTKPSSRTGTRPRRVQLEDPLRALVEVDLDALVLEPFLGERDAHAGAVRTARCVDQLHGSSPIRFAICAYRSAAGGSSAGDAAVRAMRRTSSSVGAGEPRDERRVRLERELVAVRQRAVVRRDREVLVDHPAALVEAEAHDLALDRERDRDRAEPLGQLLREAAMRLAVGVEHRVGDADPALATTSPAAPRAAAGTARPRAAPRPRRRSARASSSRCSPACSCETCSSSGRAAPSSKRFVSSKPRRAPHRARELVRRRAPRGSTHVRAVASGRRQTQRRAAPCATPCRRARVADVRRVDMSSPSLAAPRCARRRAAPSSSSARNTPPPRMSSSVSAHSSSHVSPSPSGGGHLASNSSQSSRSRLVGLGRAADRHGISEPGQQVVRRQVLEGMKLRAELVHIDTVETLGRLAEREVAGRPGVRAGEVAREEPLGRPRAEAALRGDRHAHLVVVERARARRGRASLRASATAYSALRCVKPTAKSSSGCAAAMRSRVGNAHASPTCSPKRSISRLRIATAENSETCCAVIEVTAPRTGRAGAAAGSRAAARRARPSGRLAQA